MSDEDDTKAELRKKIKDALDTKLPRHGTDDFDVILMIHPLYLLPTGSDVWQAVYTCIIARSDNFPPKFLALSQVLLSVRARPQED